MEFGAVGFGEFMYSGEVADRSPEEFRAFMDRLRAWKAKHNLKIGEGFMRVIDFNGELAYLLRAPLDGNYPYIHEFVREHPSDVQPDSGNI